MLVDLRQAVSDGIGSGLGRVFDSLARSRCGHFVAHQVEFAPVKEFPSNLVTGIEPDRRGQRQRKVNVKTRLLLSGTDGLHFEGIFGLGRRFVLVFHKLGYSLALNEQSSLFAQPLQSAPPLQ